MSLESLPSNWLLCSSTSSSDRQDWSMAQFSVAGVGVSDKKSLVCCNKPTLINMHVAGVTCSRLLATFFFTLAPTTLITRNNAGLSPRHPSCYTGAACLHSATRLGSSSALSIGVNDCTPFQLSPTQQISPTRHHLLHFLAFLSGFVTINL